MAIRYLVIEGNIGAGKTSLCNIINENYSCKLVLEEFESNPFLEKFYKDHKRYAFSVELAFLSERYNQIKKQLENYDLFKQIIVSDYYFYKSLLFASTNLDKDELILFKSLFNIIYSKLPKPDLYVYLHKSVDSLLVNIKKRARAYEQEISMDYLKNIEQTYFNYFNQITDSKILLIDTNNVDFVNNKNHKINILQTIFEGKYKNGINRVLL